MRSQLIIRFVFVCGALGATLDGLKRRADEPCAQVAAMSAEQRAANPKITPTIPGEVAFNCLQSVPLHAEEAKAVTGAILPYVQFQSDLSFKKAPPSSYPYPAVDLVGAVTKVVLGLQNNTYPNEYAWQADLFKTFMSAKDGHFRFAGDLLVRPIRFTRNVSIVSVSMDGISIPQIYLLDDIRRMNTIASFTPSPITTINGQDAVTFAQSEGDKGFQQDPDANFNTVMFNPALDFTPGATIKGFFAGDGRAGFTYPGPNTTLTFANGSAVVIPTLARVTGNFTGVTNGESAFQRFCTNPQVATAATPAASPPVFTPGTVPNSTITLKGFPKAQVIASDGSASGYYLNSPGNSDVGVLSLVTFAATTPAEFQAVIETMLAEMKRDGKTKLIVDLQGNGGGNIINGFDAFRQLFPQTQDVMFARQRIGPVYSTLADITTAKFQNFIEATADIDTIDASQTHFNLQKDLSQTRSKFASFEEKFGPTLVNGDNMSNLQQWNWADPILSTNATTGAGMDVTGYNSRQNFTQPFKPENIVMLYDGVCASTCTLFSEMMRNLGSVKSIALGGRPSTTQVQAVGGVKGAQSLEFESILTFAKFFLQRANTNGTSTISAAQRANLEQLTDLPINRSLDNGINFSDHILQANLADGTPAQFVQEPANCRMFFTPAMVMNVTNMWEAAANVAFNGKACVVGGISQGMVSSREQKPSRPRDLTKMKQVAADARKNLEKVQMKAAIQPVKKSPSWEAIHGKAIPKMLE